MFFLARLISLIAALSTAFAAPTLGQTVQPENLDPLFKAAVEGDVVRVRSSLDQGTDVNVRNRAGATLLMSAVSIQSRYEEGKIDHSKMVNLLLSRGAASDKQVGDIQTSDQQHAADSRHHH